MIMTGDLFYWVLDISILGTITGFIVMILSRVRRFPRFGIYLLWSLPFVRLWIPIGIASEYSLLSFISRYTTKTITIWEYIPGPITLPKISMTNFIQTAQNYFPIVYKTDLLRDIFSIAQTVWVIIAAATIICMTLLYIFTKAELKDAEHIRDNIYRSDRVLSPAVYGIIKPKIILPVNIAEADLEYILKHEEIHIRRKDNLWRIAAVVTACVHWFNPFVWIFLKNFFSDMELACDVGVIKTLEENDKKVYAASLLTCSLGKTFYASAFGGAKTRSRIENILSYRKLTLFSTLCFAALFIAVAFTIITNAVGG